MSAPWNVRGALPVPGDEFEFVGKVGYEFEQEQTNYEAIVSGPITEQLGARLALRRTKADDGFMSNAAGATAVAAAMGSRADSVAVVLVRRSPSWCVLRSTALCATATRTLEKTMADPAACDVAPP